MPLRAPLSAPAGCASCGGAGGCSCSSLKAEAEALNARAGRVIQDTVDLSSAAAGGLTEEERAQVRELQARDREVRAHEQAHKAAAGPYGGPISYEFQTGPDGKRYAVGGSVTIDVAPIEGDPEATIEKMETVKAAALAPAEPSAQDRAVARQADAQRARAQAELNAERQEDREAILQGEPPGERGPAPPAALGPAQGLAGIAAFSDTRAQAAPTVSLFA